MDPKLKSIPYGGYYRRDTPKEAEDITHTDPGTPLGEYMRRFWQPVCLSERLKDVPLLIRILGEDLVAFRDRSGRVGVLHRHCCHRGASLEFGIIQDRGIRCCYHGMKIDVDGYEAKILPGGRETFAAFEPFVLLELHRNELLAPFGTNRGEVVESMLALGYRGLLIIGHNKLSTVEMFDLSRADLGRLDRDDTDLVLFY